MKILELYLKAYGPFTERRIELQAGDRGLHVIFGRNEAGKSSALRAIHHLLYGIPARTPDNFLHDYASMRIGGRLRHSDGRELEFLRKKGSKNTLRSWDDADSMDDDALEPYLRGVPDELFRSFFGIDHVTLLEGGQSLLEDDGDVGKSLFAAGLGSGSLRKVISGLDADAKELFAARASKPHINAALSQLQQLKKEIKDGSLKPSAWLEHERTLAEAEEKLREIDGRLTGLRSERSRFERIGSALPLLARRTLRLEAIDEMGEVTPLAEGFEQRLGSAIEARRDALDKRSGAKERLGKLAGKLEPLGLDPAILEQRKVIELFRERLGSYKDECEQLPRREGALERLEGELAATLAALGSELTVERLDELRAPLARRRQIQDLASDRGTLLTQVESARGTLRVGAKKHEDNRAELAGLPAVRNTEGLRRAIKVARGLGEVDARVQRFTIRGNTLQGDCENELAALGHWSRGLGELARLAVPEMETVERFEREFDSLRKDRERIVERGQKAAEAIRDIDGQLDVLRRSGAVPSEEELAAQRRRRDDGWSLVRRRWIEAEPIDEEVAAFAGAELLPDVYEHSVSAADETADDLRHDADRVATQSDLLRQHERAEGEAAEAVDALAALAEGEAETQARWSAVWESLGIEPDLPREMLAWLRRQQKIVVSAAEARGQADELDGMKDGRGARRSDLLEELQLLSESVEASGEELMPVLDRSEEALESIDTVERRRAELIETTREGETSLVEAREAVELAEQELQRWRTEWVTAVEGLAVSEDARPTEALDRLDTVTKLFEKKEEIGKLADRISAMQTNKRVFEGELGDFVRLHATELADQPVEQTVYRLNGMLSEVDQQENLRSQLLEQSEDETSNARIADGRINEAVNELAILQEEAGCADEAGLAGALRGWKVLQDARSDVEQIEQQLLEASGGTSIAQLESEAQEIDRDSLPGRLEALQRELDELDAQRTGHMNRRAAARAELDRMDGSAKVATLAEQAQEVQAELRRDIERYMELTLARVILEREIEQYRKEHQAPVLVRARELFRELTLGAYTNIQIHYDEGDHPQLMGVRENGRTVGVAGMSSGTRDQLFLALRLATLEGHLDRSEPMPFIIDDILVNFDDERARATLDVLAGLGERTQVLLFTHHGRIREHAEALGERAAVLDLGES